MNIPKVIASSLIIVLFSVLVWSLSIFFWPSKIFIVNDFTDITSKTLIRSPAGEIIAVVDNVDYINTQCFLGLYRYNPSTRTLPPPAAVAGIAILDAQNLTTLRDSTLVVYDPRLKELLVSAPMDLKKRPKVLALLPNAIDRQHVQDFFQRMDRQAAQKVASPTREQQQFYQDNNYEMTAAMLVWHFFHHHDAMLGPISAHQLGKSNAENNFFYGWLDSLALAKLIHLTGGFNFQHYLVVLYSFYPLYYFLWIGLIYYLTRDVTLTLLATVLGCGSIYLTGFEETRFQPGLNPLRHYLDLPTLLFFSLFLSVENYRRYGYLLLSLLLSAFAILNNMEFGLSLTAALFGCLLVYGYVRQRGLMAIYLIIAMALTIFAFFLLPKTPYSLLKYFFLGVATPAANFTLVYLIGAGSALAYLFLLFDKKNSLASKLSILFMVFYVQACAMYCVIYSAAAHVRALFPIAIIGLILLLKNLLAYINPIERKNFWLALFIPSCFFYLIGQLSYVNIYLSFLEVKKNHQVYFWDFKRAQFFTDMDPKPFANSLRLLDRYAPEPGIYLLSKYDSILYWLSDHYSQLPYGALGVGVPSLHEQAIVVAKLKRADSCYLFVDADIASSHFGDVRNDDPRYTDGKKPKKFRSYDIGTLSLYYSLADIFYQVRANYHLKERGDLLDVYEANRCQ